MFFFVAVAFTLKCKCFELIYMSRRCLQKLPIPFCARLAIVVVVVVVFVGAAGRQCAAFVFGKGFNTTIAVAVDGGVARGGGGG